MAWTGLTYPFGSKLTSAKMTQNQDNFTALANGDSGAPQIQTAGLADGAATSAKVGVLLAANYGTASVGQAAIGASAVGQSELAANSVGQSELKDTTGLVSTASTTLALLTLPGGAYGFYPQIRSTDGNARVRTAVIGGDGAASVDWNTSFVTRIALEAAPSDGTLYAQQRYFTASSPYDLGDGSIPLFVFVLVDSLGKVVSVYTAPEAPWHYNGPTDIKGKLAPDGRKYQLKKKVQKGPRFGEDIITYEQVEITQAIKNADMGLIPHPFIGNDLTNKTIILLDPVSDMIWKMRDSFEDNQEELHELFYQEKLIIDPTELSRNKPNGVICCAAKWKDTGA